MRQRGKILKEQDRPQMTRWRMSIACWIPKATDTQSEYVILVVLIALLPQKWLHERASSYVIIRCLTSIRIRYCCFMLRPILAMFREVVLLQTSQYKQPLSTLEQT
jgi:hypothetical protein